MISDTKQRKDTMKIMKAKFAPEVTSITFLPVFAYSHYPDYCRWAYRHSVTIGWLVWHVSILWKKQ